MKKTYSAPSLSIENVAVESGIAATAYGEIGTPGQDSMYVDFSDSL